jgi:hypothetical protein
VSPDPAFTLNKSYSNNNRESIDQEWRQDFHLLVTHRCEETTCAWIPRIEIRFFILIGYNPYRSYAVQERIGGVWAGYARPNTSSFPPTA